MENWGELADAAGWRAASLGQAGGEMPSKRRARVSHCSPEWPPPSAAAVTGTSERRASISATIGHGAFAPNARPSYLYATWHVLGRRRHAVVLPRDMLLLPAEHYKHLLASLAKHRGVEQVRPDGFRRNILSNYIMYRVHYVLFFFNFSVFQTIIIRQ